MAVSESALIFLQGLVVLFDSDSLRIISIGVMVALVGWGVGRFMEGITAFGQASGEKTQ